MAFDPSVISQIPDYAPDPMAAKAKGFKLADMVNTEQLNQLYLNEEKRKIKDADEIRGILKGKDISKPEGVSQAASALSMGGHPEEALKLMGLAQQNQTGAYQQETAKLELASKQADILAGALDNVYGQLEDFRARNPKAPPETLDNMAAVLAAPAMKALKQQYPELGQYIDKFGQNPQNLTYAGIKSAEASTNRGQAMLKERLAERAQSTKEEHERTFEKDVLSKDTDREARRKALSEGIMPDEDAQFLAKQYIAGDKSVFQNLGRGAQGAKNIIKLREAVRKEAEAQGLQPEQVAGRIAEFNATVAEERKIGSIAGAVEFASSELNKFIPLALKSSADVPRGNFMPFTRMIQVGEKNLSDPKLKRLYVNTQGVLNAYDVLAARGGSDKDKREHNRQMLMTADSQEAYATALDAMKQELDVAKEAGPEAKERVGSELTRKPKDAPFDLAAAAKAELEKRRAATGSQ